MLSLSGADGINGDFGGVRDHIEKLAETAEATQIVSINGGVGGGGEAQVLIPYINTFETSLGENKRLLSTLTDRMELLTTSIAEDSGDLHSRINSMGEAFSELFSQFQSLQSSYDGCQSVASRSGKLIESLHRQKRKSQDVKELFTIFSEIASGRGTAKLDAVLESNLADTRLHGAQLMRRLQVLGRAGIAGQELAKELDEVAQKYEGRLLTEFHAAFEENNLPAMRSAASLLVKYNGGDSCIKSFISQHSFFIEPIKAEDIRSANHPSGEPGPLDLGKPPSADPILVTLYEQIAQTAEADWNYLEAVFEDPVRVMNFLMQRIFREPVQIHLEEIFKQARSHSSLTYLRTLHASYRATRELISRMQKSYARHVKEIGARNNQLSSVIDDKLSSIESQLDYLLVDLFAPHIQSQAYVSMEITVLCELLSVAVSPMQTYATQLRKSAKGMISISAVFGRSGAASPMPSGQHTASAGSAASPDKYSSLFIFGDGKPLLSSGNSSNGGSADPSLPSEEVVQHCLVLHAELSARLYQLLPAGEARGRAILQGVKTLFAYLFDRYMELGLDCASEASEVSSKGFDPRSFASIQATCRVLGLILLYCRESLLPLMVSASSVCYREMVQMKTEAAAKITEKIDKVLRKECDGALTFIEEHLLSKQRKSDFKPKPDDLEALMGPSQACQLACDFVAKLAKVVIERLDQRNATTFLSEFGSSLHFLLLAHLKNYSVSDSGAMVIQNDLKNYRALVDVMKPARETLNDRFEMLWELGHLFVVRPENLRSILQEGFLGRLEPKLIYPYIAMRADYSSAKIDLLFPDMEKSFSRLFL